MEINSAKDDYEPLWLDEITINVKEMRKYETW